MSSSAAVAAAERSESEVFEAMLKVMGVDSYDPNVRQEYSKLSPKD